MNKLEEIFEEINLIKEKGHIVFIKFDGAREKDKITVVLNIINEGERQVVQKHGDDLLILLDKLLSDYRKLCN